MRGDDRSCGIETVIADMLHEELADEIGEIPTSETVLRRAGRDRVEVLET